MSDNISLHINGQRLDRFESYRVESDLFQAADAFEVVLAGPEADVAEGQKCTLHVNGRLELTGLVDAVEKSFSKNKVGLAIRGRDLMGLLADSYTEEFGDIDSVSSLEGLAAKLLKNVPFINRSKIQYGKEDKNRAVILTDRQEDFEYVQIRPGQTVFEVLKSYAMSRGYMFFALPDGTFVFGQPRTSGKAGFFITARKDGQGNNAMTGSLTNDISRRFSKVVIVDQAQGEDVTATVTDPDFPFPKPFVATAIQDGEDAAKYGRLLLDKMRFDGFSLSYTVPGHSQNGKNWTTNAVVHVQDEILGVSGVFLITGRTFELSKTRGVTTSLNLSRLGVLPV